MTSVRRGNHQFLLVRRVRKRVGRLRLWYYMSLRKRWRTLNSEDAFDLTLEHNARQVRNFSNDRICQLVRPICALETLDDESKILVIGPRNENDLLILKGYGFKNVRGLDLYSYSPWIDVGDMHEMPYEDGTFDAVLCGWTLSYSKSPQKAAREMARVTRDGGVIGLAVEYQKLDYKENVELMGYSVVDRGFERINSTGQILDLFPGQVGDVYFSHDAPLKRSPSKADIRGSSVITVFSLKKARA